MKMRFVTVAIGCLLLLTASAVGAEEPWDPQETLARYWRAQIDEWNQELADLEADQRIEESKEIAIEVEELGANTTWSTTVQLQPGKRYIIMAVCDGNCYDIDLYAYDFEENPLTDDTEPDALPVVELPVETAIDDGVEGAEGEFVDGAEIETLEIAPLEYLLEVVMLDCQAESCYAAIGVGYYTSSEEERNELEGLE